MIPLVMSGGSGTRLWPISRSYWPKQHCNLFAESLQDLTLKRCSRLGTPWLITGLGLKTLNETSLKKNKIPLAGVIYEPQAHNTAPAVGLFCRILELQNQIDDVVAVFPADHLIQNEELFVQVCHQAEALAKQGFIVTLGMSPSYPETGFGYIQKRGQALNQDPIVRAFAVEKFHEKPSLETAKKFLASGEYSWNAGIFIFQTKKMIAAFAEHQPSMWKSLQKLQPDQSNLKAVYDEIQNISLDYAILEKLGRKELACIPVEIGWSDVGSWDAVSEKYLSQGMQHSAQKPVLEIHSENNFVYSQLNKQTVLVGVDQLIVVDTEDALLITQKGQSQDVKSAVEVLQKLSPSLIQDHVFEVRPWGDFEILRDTQAFKSKVIRINALSQISYQSHTKREEHWIITKGQGEVILNEKKIEVKVGTHIHIPLGAKHRIRNTMNEILEFVEIQLGTYFGEDDIVRYQDDYQRT